MGVFKGSATCKITGLEDDLKKIEERFYAALGKAYGVLEDDMEACLGEHIAEDVYDAYPDPTVYERRKDKGGLLDFDSNLKKGGSSDEAKIEYEPSGESEQWYHPVDGDELIRRIESRNPQYEWVKDMPERPFFQNFVAEMIEGGRAEMTLVDVMNGLDKDLGVTSYDYGVERDGNEWVG